MLRKLLGARISESLPTRLPIMPVRESEDPAQPSTLENGIREDFLLFYASRDEAGKMWCPDCVAVDDLVQRTFGPKDGPSVFIVHVGQRAEWKSQLNPFRADPWKVESIPTIIRVRDGARLVDKEIDDRLASFLLQ